MDQPQQLSLDQPASREQNLAGTLTIALASDILESTNDAVCAVDAHWRIIYVNRKAEEMTGQCRAELLGKNLWAEFPQAVGTDAYHQLLATMRTRRSVELEYEAPLAPRWFDIRAERERTGGLLQ